MMLPDSFDHLVPVMGWMFVPTLATRFVHNIYYTLTTRKDARPPMYSPQWQKHRKYIHIGLILLYLFYTVLRAFMTMRAEGDFYRSLDLAHDAQEKAIRSRFRRLAALHHPDKLGPDAGNDTTVDTMFMQLRQAHDTLNKPAQRFAYDRFGPEALQWEKCATIAEYLEAALKEHAPMHIGAAVVLVGLSMTGHFQGGRFWRFLVAGGLVLVEAFIMTRPRFPMILTHAINPFLTRILRQSPLLPFQFLSIIRQLNVAFLIAAAQLGPYFNALWISQDPEHVWPWQMEHVERMADASEVTSMRLLGQDLAPFTADAPSSEHLQQELQQWLVQNTLRADPTVSRAIAEAAQRLNQVAKPEAQAQVENQSQPQSPGPLAVDKALPSSPTSPVHATH